MPSESIVNDVDDYLQEEMLNSIINQCKSASGDIIPSNSGLKDFDLIKN